MTRTSFAVALVVVVLLSFSTVRAQFGFEGCGLLVADLEGGCFLFQAPGGTRYILDDYGGFRAGDSVWVAGDFGTIGNPCPWCGTFQYPCIHNYLIESCGTPVDCCQGRVGDANGLGGDEPTIGDVSSLIDAKFITGTCDGILYCLREADINQSGGCDPTCDDITIGDISMLIDQMFLYVVPFDLPPCLQCPL